MSDFGQRLRQANVYASANGFIGAFPNFYEADHGKGMVYGTFLIKSDFVEWRDVPTSALGYPAEGDIGTRFRATAKYAGENGFIGGFPNFFQADYGNGMVFGTLLMRSNAGEWRDVPARELGNPPDGDAAARFRATHDYATRHGFAAGFPNFFQADYGSGMVYGTMLFRAEAVEWRDVSAPDVPIEVWFSGFQCLDESNEWSGSDEPYMFLGVSSSGTPQTPYETGVFDDVDVGEVTSRVQRLYAGPAQDIILATLIREQDQGDPKAFSAGFKEVLNVGNTLLQAKTGVKVPDGIVESIASGLSELTGAGDDYVGQRAELLTKSTLLDMANRREGGSPASDFSWDVGNDDAEGGYRLFFFVRSV